MNINSTIEKITQSLLKEPKKINSLNSILTLLLREQKDEVISIENLQKINKLFSLYYDTFQSDKVAKLFDFVSEKAVVYAEILIRLMIDPSEEFSSFDYFQLIVDFTKGVKIQSKVVQIFVQKIKQGLMDDWSSVINAQIITEICLRLAKQNEYNSNIITFLKTLNHTNSIDFQKNCIHLSMNPSQNEKNLKKAYENTLIHFLVLGQISEKEQKVRMYRSLGDKLFSKFISPLMLAQFLLDKFSNEGQEPEVQIQVLSSLFILVGKYGLEMQKFYEKLQIMMGKQRSHKSSIYKLSNSKRFFKLVQSAMRSSRVPFKTILSLSKIFISQVYHEQTQFSFWALSFFVNLVKKHRNLQNHLSQLPQIEALKYHYSGRIRSLVGQLTKNLNKSEYLDIEQFGKVNMKKVCEEKLQEIEETFTETDKDVEFRFKEERKIRVEKI